MAYSTVTAMQVWCVCSLLKNRVSVWDSRANGVSIPMMFGTNKKTLSVPLLGLVLTWFMCWRKVEKTERVREGRVVCFKQKGFQTETSIHAIWIGSNGVTRLHVPKKHCSTERDWRKYSFAVSDQKTILFLTVFLLRAILKVLLNRHTYMHIFLNDQMGAEECPLSVLSS